MIFFFLLWNKALSEETSTSSRALRSTALSILKMETPRRMWPKCLTKRVIFYYFNNWQAQVDCEDVFLETGTKNP